MLPDSHHRLRAFAEVAVRVGLNLQRGQRLLITDPYDLLGVPRDTGGLVNAIRFAAMIVGCPPASIEVISSDPAALRAVVAANDTRAYEKLLTQHTVRLERHLAAGGAFLFLVGSHPGLFSGLGSDHLAEFERLKWQQLGPVIQQLVSGASQWTLIPAPTPRWAGLAFSGLPEGEQLPALWETLFSAFRVSRTAPTGPGALEAWTQHLTALDARRQELNAARHRVMRYVGEGTDLTVELPSSHVWCTAQLQSTQGIPFVVNLPTEEVYTAPHKNSASGKVRVAQPVIHGGELIDGIELEFARGRVVQARATTGQEFLEKLLETDGGSGRLGEVALVTPPAWAAEGETSRGRRGSFQNILLDENAAHHIALGDSYRFCNDALLPLALNTSLIHLDLPLRATVEFS